MHTPSEQLGRLARELGEALALALGDEAGRHGEVVVEVVRATVADAPSLTVGVGDAGALRAVAAKASIRACLPKLLALGGKYREWLHVTIRFHGPQLPIPVEVSVRPLVHDHPHHG